MRNWGRALSLLGVAFGLAALLPMPVSGQVLYGSMVGTIEDSAGAVVPNAGITLTNTGTGAVRDAKADEQGRYTFVNVLPGTYELKVVASGFKPAIFTGLDISANVVTRQDVRLEVGAITESVTVNASAAQLQTDKAEVRHSITTTELKDVPLPNVYRNYQALINLVPGATPAGFQNAVVDTPSRSLTTNINGTARNNNNTLVDGAANIFIWLPHQTYYVPAADSIAEVNITTGSFDAEQGMTGGAAVTVTTKSGTNEFHGTASWFHNDQHLNGGPYFRAKNYVKPLSILNQPSVTLGGPIKKNKVFFFFSYERTAERTGYSSNLSVAPADFRAGDFSAWTSYSLVYDPASMVNNDPATRQPFPGNKIPAARIDPKFANIVNQLPLPNQTSPTDPFNLSGNFGVSGVLKLDRHLLDYKGNWNPTSKLAVWGKMSYLTAPVQGKYPWGDLGGPALGTEGIGDTKTYVPTMGFTYTISTRMLIDGVFGITRFDQDVNIPGLNQNGGLDVWKIPGTNGGTQYASDTRYGSYPWLNGFGFDGVGYSATWTPVQRRERTYEYRTNFTVIRGPHEMRMGFEPRRFQMTHWQPETQNPRGSLNICGSPTILPGGTVRQPNQYAAGLLGLVCSYNKSIQYLLMQTREWQLGWYFQDRWQVTRNLTLMLGLRYEYYPLMNRGDRGIERWDPYTNTVYMGGFGSVPWDVGITVSHKLFAPRVGFAYRFGDSWVIRSGYGISYDPLPFSRPLRGLYPATLTATWDASTSDASFRNSTYGWYNTLNQGIPVIPTPDTSTGMTQLPLNVDMGPRSPWGGMLHRGYIQSWNFTVERKLPSDAVVNVGYVASRTIHQMLDRNINTNLPGQDVNPNTRYLAQINGRTLSMSMWDGFGYGSYNALQVSLNKNLTHGVFLKGSYTWSKSLSMADDDGWQGLPYWNTDYSRNYAPSGYDRRHMFVLAWVYQVPFGKERGRAFSNKVAEAVAGGWQISGIFSKYSGLPFTVTGSASSLRSNGNSQTADQIGTVTKLDSERGPGKPYFDPNSFMDPLVYFNQTGIYRYGTMGRDTLYGPGFFRIDPAVYKDFRVTERVTMQFRAEGYNFTNTPRWSTPNAGAASPLRDATGKITNLNNFMCITSVFGNNYGQDAGRSFRFALRATF
ncbi:MAG: TonB-dependent receptor [Acidobacteria bacterium]|nr:TonB-dependent receptor [Acidobacteriota bacterium]